jgi:2-amino-4-hydroxy-6-hydroxymethyldihydropteridine diphosphokinase
VSRQRRTSGKDSVRAARVLAYLGIGSNVGKSRHHLERAIEEVDNLPGTKVRRVSPLYGSAPWGKANQADYTNAVVEVETTLSPRDLLKAVKSLERAHGRVPGERWGPRPLDIDILLHGTASTLDPELEVPHPRMWDRAFVLRPLADLRPDLVGRDGRTVLDRLNDDEIADQEVWLLP